MEINIAAHSTHNGEIQDEFGWRITGEDQVVELEPSIVDEPFVSERICETDDADFNVLVRSMEAGGQIVPILVRPCPDYAGRFQVAYGHRRLHAAGILRRKVRAIVRSLSDEELVVAQGKENTERHELSFIERALFARNLEIQGFGRSVLMSALSVDKTELTRLLSVARAVPSNVIRAIGPAPKAGRPRWMALAKLINSEATGDRIQQLVSSNSFRALSSDRRFEILFAAFAGGGISNREPSHWVDPGGRRIVRIERQDNQTKLLFDDRLEPDFGAFIVENLDKLYADFSSARREATI